MLNIKTGERQALDRFALLRRGLSYSLAAVGPRLPYLVALLRRRISFGLVLSWILAFIFSRRRSKPPKSPVSLERTPAKFSFSRAGSPKVVTPRKQLTIGSMGMELLVAVGLNLLRSNLKSWSSEIRPAKALPAEKAVSQVTPANDLVVKKELRKREREKSVLTHQIKKDYPKGVWLVLKTTATQWMEDKCPQLGAALAYFTVFSLAPLVLLLLALFGLFFGSENARDKITGQLQYLMDPNGIKVIQDIATSASKPESGILATVVGIIVGLFGASGVFGQLQDALNTIWGVKPKPGAGIWAFLRARFLSFAMVGGVCFLLLVSLTVESVLRGFSDYLQKILPGGHVLTLGLFLIFDLAVVIFLFAMIFRFLPDVKIAWRDVWMGASLTAILFVIGKFILGLYLGSGAAGSAYGAASSLITLLLWIYYSAQILLFGAEFTQVYANTYGSQIEPEDHAVKVQRIEVEVPAVGHESVRGA